MHSAGNPEMDAGNRIILGKEFIWDTFDTWTTKKIQFDYLAQVGKKDVNPKQLTKHVDNILNVFAKDLQLTDAFKVDFIAHFELLCFPETMAQAVIFLKNLANISQSLNG